MALIVFFLELEALDFNFLTNATQDSQSAPRKRNAKKVEKRTPKKESKTQTEVFQPLIRIFRRQDGQTQQELGKN